MPAVKGKTVLITGASSGIGKATSIYLAGKGCRVLGTSRARERLVELEREASAKGLSVECLELNIGSDEAVAKAAPRLTEEYGTVDVLVNNAGYGLWGPVESLTIDQIRKQFDVNFFAAVRMVHAFLPGMLRQGSGAIINISSILGRIGTPFNSAYAASKFAIEGFSECLRAELWPFGVWVSVVEPGLFDTGFQESRVAGQKASFEDPVYAQYVERYGARHERIDRFSHDPVHVARVIHRIIGSRRPALRHPVGIEAKAGLLGARLLPEALFQALLRRATMG